MSIKQQSCVEAMKQAIEFIESVHKGEWSGSVSRHQVRETLNQAIARAEHLEAEPSRSDIKQEPVAWMDSDGFPWSKQGVECRTTQDTYTPLYTSPPYVPTERQRQPLTDKQLNIIGSRWHLNLLGKEEKDELFAFARAIEAAHGIKE